MMSDSKYWLAFNRIQNLGMVRFRLLEKRFGSLEEAWHAGQGQLREAGLDGRTISSILSGRPSISPDEEAEKLERVGVQAVTWHDPIYPARLKEIHDPPLVLYFQGSLLPEDERSVAVVGTRSATSYGREVASLLSGGLASSGITIVSGLARGIDGIAHQAALKAGGRTIAVLASGLDIIYPPEHASLARSICQKGALMTEHPLGTKPHAKQFPRRNRLMSGMTLGTLVVEAGEGSGAMWTVRHALEQDREVFCVPGSIFSPTSRVTNGLIQQGAKLVSKTEDVLEELNLSAIPLQLEMPAVAHADGDEESLLLSHISLEPIHIDEIRSLAELPISVVSGTLAMLELKGLVQSVGGMNYIRAREVVAPYGR